MKLQKNLKNSVEWLKDVLQYRLEKNAHEIFDAMFQDEFVNRYNKSILNERDNYLENCQAQMMENILREHLTIYKEAINYIAWTCPNLRVLRIKFLKEPVNEEAIANIFKHCKKLLTFEFTYMNTLPSNSLISSVGKHAHKLHELTISSPKADQFDTFATTTALRSLSLLSVGGQTKVTNTSLSYFMNNYNLGYLEIEHAPINNKGLEQIYDKFSLLKVLKLVGCQVSINGFYGFCNAYLPHMQVIDFSRSEELAKSPSPVVMEYLSNSTFRTTLQEVYLSGVINYASRRDECIKDLNRLINHVPNLKKVVIPNCCFESVKSSLPTSITFVL